MRILCVVGTRPNFVKMAALYREMRTRQGFEPTLVHTGQHYDANMSRIFFEELGLPEPDIDLDVAGGSVIRQTCNIMQRLDAVLEERLPDVMVVVGDVNSTLAASLTAMKTGVTLAHVEAGLRSGDRTMPEELNRIVVDHLSDMLFVTEQSGMDNLRREGIDDERIFFVGNVMVDTLMDNIEKAKKSDILHRIELSPNSYAIATIHRPANSDDRDALGEILGALCEISRDIPLLLPLHPRTRQRIEEFGLWTLIEEEKGFMVSDPLGYLDFLSVMAHARVVFTDSGGIQEETTILGVPCITMRNNTERPITIESGTNKLAGTHGADIIHAYRSLTTGNKKSYPHPPLWDGKAAGRILDILEKRIGT